MILKINEVEWELFLVDPNHSGLYVNGNPCVGTTWSAKAQIYIADNLAPSKMLQTIRHEITHAFMDSTQIREPETYTEEDVCEFVAKYGPMVLRMSDDIFKELQKQKQ